MGKSRAITRDTAAMMEAMTKAMETMATSNSQDQREDHHRRVGNLEVPGVLTKDHRKVA